MAKKEKKSRVGRDFPSAEQTNKVVKAATGQKTTTESFQLTNPVAKRRGRPKATHGKIRFTTLIHESSRDTLKNIATITNTEVNELYSTAVMEFIAKWKLANPSLIDTLDGLNKAQQAAKEKDDK